MHDPHLRCPFTGGHTSLGAGDRGGHDVFTLLCGFAQCRQCGVNSGLIALGAPRVQAFDLFGLYRRVHDHDTAIARGQRRGFGFGPLVHANHDGFVLFDPVQAVGVRFYQTRFHVFDRGNSAAHRIQIGQFVTRTFFQRLDLAVHGGVAVEQVFVFQQVGFIGHDLLHTQRPLLIPWAGQAKCFVPSGQLHGTGAGLFRQGHSQHFDQDAVDVIFRLLFRQPQRVHLHTITETTVFRILDAIAGF